MRGIDVTEGMRVLVGPVTSVRRYGIVRRVDRNDSGGASALVVFDEDWFDASELEPGRAARPPPHRGRCGCSPSASSSSPGCCST